MDKFKGRKYKFSDEEIDSTILSEETLLKLEKKISHMDVTVVLLSRNIIKSNIIPLEIEYSLNNTHSKTTKGIIGVVIPDKGNDYSYMMKKGHKGIWRADKSKLPTLMSYNINNEVVVENKNNVNYDSFISIYRWEDFINDFNNCVNIAYEKANESLDKYKITN
jgi:biopolymer transport protein ExbD